MFSTLLTGHFVKGFMCTTRVQSIDSVYCLLSLIFFVFSWTNQIFCIIMYLLNWFLWVTTIKPNCAKVEILKLSLVLRLLLFQNEIKIKMCNFQYSESTLSLYKRLPRLIISSPFWKWNTGICSNFSLKPIPAMQNI